MIADLVNIPIVHSLSPEAQFEHDAWTDADVMRVLADNLLEKGSIEALSEIEASLWVQSYSGMDQEDYALFRLECDVRQWLMRSCDRHFELRVTGRWPEVRFVVLYQQGIVPPWLKKDRIPFRGAPEDGQPRLLRAMPQSGEEP